METGLFLLYERRAQLGWLKMPTVWEYKEHLGALAFLNRPN